MTWTKTASDFPDRLIDLSDAAYRLNHAAITYSNRVGTDGWIPKSRLSLVPVPTRTRRMVVVRELEVAGLWVADGDGWTIIDFFEAQPSAEEARLTTEYHRVREAVRLAKDAQKRGSFEREKVSVLERLNEAREQRKALSRGAIGSANGNAPLRFATSRSASKRERGRERTPSADGLEATASGPIEMPKPKCDRCTGSLGPNPRRLHLDGRYQNYCEACANGRSVLEVVGR